MSKRMLLNIVTNEKVPFSKIYGNNGNKEKVTSSFIFLKQNVSTPEESIKRYKKIDEVCLTNFEEKLPNSELSELKQLEKICRELIDIYYGMTPTTGEGSSDLAAAAVTEMLKQSSLVKTLSLEHGNSKHEFLYVFEGVYLYPWTLYANGNYICSYIQLIILKKFPYKLLMNYIRN